MAYKYARTEFRKNTGTHSRVHFQVCKLTDATTIQGGVDGVWEVDSAGAFDITVADYDRTHFSEYPTPPNKPYIIIKSNLDKTGGATAVKTEAGVTLYTFALDGSATPQYCVLTLDEPTAGKFEWKLAA